MYRLVFAVLTESGGLVYANDGLAFSDNAEQVRPGWAEGVPLDQRAKIRTALRTSLTFPHDAVGNNGGSTGCLQQLSQDYVGERFPGSKWGWGALADTMDVGKACTMFLGRLVITTDRTYQGMDFDPIAADVLRVQQPKLSEAGSGNYSAARVAVAKDIVDNWGPTYFVGKPSAEPHVVAVGGAQTSRGVVWLDDLPGGSPADKLRQAWGGNDRRAVIVSHGTVLDVGADPIPVPAGVCLAGPAGPQTEFSDQGRVFLRGASAAFRSVPSGPNFTGTKGWSFVNLGFEGTGGLNLFTPNPMNAAGPIMAYASIEGCSFDNFRTIVESPLLGCHWDIRYFNNIAGPYAFKLAGSDNQLWTHGGKGDWGGGNTDPKRQALIVLSYLEKSTFGAGDTGGGLYLTCQGAAGMDIEGNADRDGIDIFGMTVEGRNAGAPSAGALVRVRGGGVNFHGGNFNFAMSNPGSTGRDDKAFIDVTDGRLGMNLSVFRRGTSTAPFVARRGTGVVDLIGCRESPSKQPVTVTNL